VDGTLSVVATPIGNLGDLTLRAAEVLRTVDLVLAEDTRRTGKLLAHIESGVPQLSLHEHNERDRLEEILARLEAGEHLALVSDAGTPTVSDPGYRVLAACAQRGVRIVPVPGASAALAALVVSGFPTDRVVLDGFLPRKGGARRERLAALADEVRTTVLFLSPHRAAADLADLVEAVGGLRPAVLCRELTKLHEEVRRGTVAELASSASSGLRGEVTLVLAGAIASPAAEVSDAELVERVRGRVATGTDRKAAIGEVARAVEVPRRRVYQAVIDAKGTH
jgi:16S rRNA (cytidine1402-2'-O)-methyltransferase